MLKITFILKTLSLWVSVLSIQATLIKGLYVSVWVSLWVNQVRNKKIITADPHTKNSHEKTNNIEI